MRTSSSELLALLVSNLEGRKTNREFNLRNDVWFLSNLLRAGALGGSLLLSLKSPLILACILGLLGEGLLLMGGWLWLRQPTSRYLALGGISHTTSPSSEYSKDSTGRIFSVTPQVKSEHWYSTY